MGKLTVSMVMFDSSRDWRNHIHHQYQPFMDVDSSQTWKVTCIHPHFLRFNYFLWGTLNYLRVKIPEIRCFPPQNPEMLVVSMVSFPAVIHFPVIFHGKSGYPLVTCYITMENHKFSWENSLFLWLCSMAILT